MNKIIYYLKNILLFINFILFICCATNVNEYSILRIFIYGVVTIALITFSVIDYIKADKIVENRTFNIISNVAQLLILFIYLRTYLDYRIFLNNEAFSIASSINDDSVTTFSGDFQAIFININLIYFILLNSCLLGYNLLNRQFDKKKHSS